MTAYLKIILRNFLFRKRRTLLTMLGITIGSTLILTLILLGEGLKSALTAQLQAFGSDLIFILPGKQSNPLAAFQSGSHLKDEDLRVVQDTPGVAMAMGEQVKDFRVGYNGEKKVVNVSGTPWRETIALFGVSQGFQIDKGEWPVRDEQNAVVLGRLVANGRFSRPIQVGEELVIDNKRFLVAGILKPTGASDDDSRIYMSLDRFRVLTGQRTGMMIILAKAASGADVKHVADDVLYNLERRRSAGDFSVFTSDNALQIIGGVLGVVQLVLGAFAAVALVVGGVNIMNTMFTSVLERTREVGVMKALGATDRSILMLFLSEAGLLGVFGGTLGIGISYLFAKAIEFAAASRSLSILKISFSPLIVLGTLVFTFVIGAIFGAIPAIRAARLRPTEALRYE